MAVKKSTDPDFSVQLHSVTSAKREEAELDIQLGKREITVVGAQRFKLRGQSLLVELGALSKMGVTEDGDKRTVTFDGIYEGETHTFEVTLSADYLSTLNKAIAEKTTNAALRTRYFVYRKNQGDTPEQAEAAAEAAYGD